MLESVDVAPALQHHIISGVLQAHDRFSWGQKNPLLKTTMTPLSKSIILLGRPGGQALGCSGPGLWARGRYISSGFAKTQGRLT